MTSASDPQSPARQTGSAIVSRSLTEAQRRAMDDVLDGKPLATPNGDVTTSREDVSDSDASTSVTGSPERKRRDDVTDDLATDSVNNTTFMQACLDSYKHLFCVFVTSRVLGGRREEALRLVRSLVSDDACSAQEHRSTFADVISLTGDVFCAACRLLIDFASFPLFCNNSQLVLKESMKQGEVCLSCDDSCD